MKKIKDFKQFEVKNIANIKGGNNGNNNVTDFACADPCLETNDSKMLCGNTDHF